MDNTEEKRLCKKCGKRLPSSNNFCMYCGCNNNISDEELADLQSVNDKNLHSQSKQELLNKSIAAKDRPLNIEKGASNSPGKKIPPEERGKLPLIAKLIYLFMLLVIIIMSTVLAFNTNNMFFNKFKYNFDNYDKYVNLNNETFIGLKNNKIEIIGDKSTFSDSNLEIIDKINKQKVLDIGKFNDYSSNYIYLKTKKGLYSVADYGTISLEKTKELSDDLLTDINVGLNRNESLDGKYYSIIGEDSYFIKDDSLYKSVLVEKYHYDKEKETLSNLYTSEKVIDKSELDITNPKIVDIYSSNDSIVILGDNTIKTYTKGTLVSSVDKFTIGDKEYNISDFKYIFYNNGKVSLVDENNRIFKKDIGTNLNISNYDNYGYYYYGKSNQAVPKAKAKDLNQNITINRNGTHNSLYFKFSPLKDNYKTTLIVLGIIILLVGAMYFCKEKPFLISMGILSGVSFVLILIYLAYYLSQTKVNIKIDDVIKQLFSYIPYVLLSGYILTLIKEIVAYISEKLNVETIYHFVLIALALITSMLALVVVNESTFMAAAAIGIMWTYICFNDEDYVSNNTDIIKLIPILGILIGSLVFGVILSNMLEVANYYFYIIVIAFCFAYYLALNNSITIGNSIFKMFKANSVIIFSLVAVVVSLVFSLISLFGKDSAYFTKLVTETIWAMIKSVFCLLAALLVIGTIAGILLFLISKLGILLNKINNRPLKVFIYFVIMIVFVSFIMYLMPQIESLLEYILRILLKINSNDPLNLASSSLGL